MVEHLDFFVVKLGPFGSSENSLHLVYKVNVLLVCAVSAISVSLVCR